MFKSIYSFFNKGESRSIKAKKNILAMFFLKGLSLIMSLFIVPITINYVTSFQYGIWLTISSLASWLSFSDIGLGDGLRNKFIESISLGKKKQAKTYVSTTYAMLIIIIGGVWLIACLASFYINWSSVLNAPIEMKNDLTKTVLIVLTHFCFQFILRIVTTLLIAIQKPAFASLFDTLSQILLVTIIILLIKFTHGSLVLLALAMGISNIFILLVGNIGAFSSELKEYKPQFRYINFSVAKNIMSLGFKFFFLQIIAIIIYQTNNIIISHFLGPSQVTVYNVAYKYMYILTMVYTIILSPFWSAFAEAKTIGDYEWMKNVTSKLRKIFFILMSFGLFMVFISPQFFKMWVGNTVTIPYSITILMFLYNATNIWGTLHTQILAGLGKIKIQLIFSTICGVINIPICLTLCKYYELHGLIIGNIFVLALFGSWFGYLQVNKLLSKKANGIWNE